MSIKAGKKQVEFLWDRPILKTKTMRQMVHRVGALEVLEMPSRMANTLYYPDGRVVKDKQ
jgi:hypothetical protein